LQESRPGLQETRRQLSRASRKPKGTSLLAAAAGRTAPLLLQQQGMTILLLLQQC
jgi:hypothetical protein